MRALYHLAAMTLVAWGFGDTHAAEGKRKTPFVSPQAAFEVWQKALGNDDGAAAADCVTESYRDEALVSFWDVQFHFRHTKPTLHPFIDEAKRQRLTREKLPIRGEELSPILLECIADKHGAYAAAISAKTQSEYYFGDLISGELTRVSISGERAVGTARMKQRRYTDTLEFSLHFTRDDQGWRIDREPQRESDPLPKIANPRPWTREHAPQFGSPQEVYSAFDRGFAERDPELIWHCSSERKRNDMCHGAILMLVESGGGDSIIAWYYDFRVPPAKPTPVSNSRPTTRPQTPREEFEQREKRAALYCGFYFDQRVYFSAVVKMLSGYNDHLKANGRHRPNESLREVIFNGDRAQGNVKKYLWTSAQLLKPEGKREELSRTESSYDQPYYFQRTDKGWIVDLETFEEENGAWPLSRE